MARPRMHTYDELLDAAEQLVTGGGAAGFTLRALATSTGASNGTIYHAFRSKEEMIARLWLRAAERLGTIINTAVSASAVEAAPGGGAQGGGAQGGDLAREAVVAVALSPVTFAERYPASARLFFAQRRDQLFSTDLSPEIVTELQDIQTRFTERLVGLARGVWDRGDRVAVEAIAACVVDIPGGLLRRHLLEGHSLDPAIGRRIEVAVRAILTLPL